jgi:uncharacterized membrane protein
VTPSERAGIAEAIAAAEDGTSGRIAVRVIPDGNVNAFERAKHEFGRIGLQRHPSANAALILVAPKARQFAVIGDRALHERVGDAFWDDVVKESQRFFAAGNVSAGVLYAIDRIGQALHEHFLVPAKGGAT